MKRLAEQTFIFVLFSVPFGLEVGSEMVGRYVCDDSEVNHALSLMITAKNANDFTANIVVKVGMFPSIFQCV